VPAVNEKEKFIGDFDFAVEQVEGENRLIFSLTAGTFLYGVTPEVILPVPTGRFSRGDENAPQVADVLFDALDSIREITIEARTITVVYDSDMEAEQVRSRLRRPVNNAVANDRGTITAEVSQAAEKTIEFSTSDDRFRYAQYQPALVESIEEYDSRTAAEAGSDLARFIVAESRPVESLRLEPTRLVVGYAESAALEPLARNLREILNDFHPRASLAPDLWLLTAAPEIIPPLLAIAVEPLKTGVPLFLFTLLMVAVEGGIFFVAREGKNRQLIHLVHIASGFLPCRPVVRHKPIWATIVPPIWPSNAHLLHRQSTGIVYAA